MTKSLMVYVKEGQCVCAEVLQYLPRTFKGYLAVSQTILWLHS